MLLTPLPTELILPQTPLLPYLQASLTQAGITLQEKDLVVVSSKVVAVSEGRIKKLSDYPASDEAKKWSEISGADPSFMQAVLEESEQVVGACPGALLTVNEASFIANAGIDLSNVEKGSLILWPEYPMQSAQTLRNEIATTYALQNFGLVISDSHCLPLRQGTVGYALAYAGFEPVIDERGREDLFGNIIRITKRNMADGLAVAANLLMGDTTEKIPFVLIRDITVNFCDDCQETIIMPKDECIFRDLYQF